MGDDRQTGYLAGGIDARHHVNGAAKAIGGVGLHHIALFTGLIDGQDGNHRASIQGNIPAIILYFFIAIRGKDHLQGVLDGLLCVGRDGRCRNLVDQAQQSRNHQTDEGQNNHQHSQSGFFLRSAHASAPSFAAFLAAFAFSFSALRISAVTPNRLGRVALSMSQTQMFIMRME